MRIRWTVPGADDLEHIKNYLEEHYATLSFMR
jgi:plasmid stabilization system protein ParE